MVRQRSAAGVKALTLARQLLHGARGPTLTPVVKRLTYGQTICPAGPWGNLLLLWLRRSRTP